LLLAGDWPQTRTERHSVTALSMPGRCLAFTTIRRHVDSALDVGTGSGIQALLAARHAERVLGTDVNPYALSLADIAQQLNGLPKVDWVEGSWFEPVRGELFDLVVANPPVTISPDNAILARDSGFGGAELSGRVIRQAADHLAEGGFATVLCNWTHGTHAW